MIPPTTPTISATECGEPARDAHIDEQEDDGPEKREQRRIQERAAEADGRRVAFDGGRGGRHLGPREGNLLADERTELAAQIAEQLAEGPVVSLTVLVHRSFPEFGEAVGLLGAGAVTAA